MDINALQKINILIAKRECCDVPEFSYLQHEIESLFSWLNCEMLFGHVSPDDYSYLCNYIEVCVLEQYLNKRKETLLWN